MKKLFALVFALGLVLSASAEVPYDMPIKIGSISVTLVQSTAGPHFITVAEVLSDDPLTTGFTLTAKYTDKNGQGFNQRTDLDKSEHGYTFFLILVDPQHLQSLDVKEHHVGFHATR